MLFELFGNKVTKKRCLHNISFLKPNHFWSKSSAVLAPIYSRSNELPSTREGLTAVFGMGTGVAPLEMAPEQQNLLTGPPKEVLTF